MSDFVIRTHEMPKDDPEYPGRVEARAITNIPRGYPVVCSCLSKQRNNFAGGL